MILIGRGLDLKEIVWSRGKDEDSFQVPKREARSADLEGTACAVLRVRKARERVGLRKRKRELKQ